MTKLPFFELLQDDITGAGVRIAIDQVTYERYLCENPGPRPGGESLWVRCS
ncbi:MAG: hypothetical protein ACXW4C_10235 [Nitrospira sp.]